MEVNAKHSDMLHLMLSQVCCSILNHLYVKGGLLEEQLR